MTIPDPTGDLLSYVEIESDHLGGAYVRQWSRFTVQHAFTYYGHRWRSFRAATIQYGKTREGHEVIVNGEKV